MFKPLLAAAAAFAVLAPAAAQAGGFYGLQGGYGYARDSGYAQTGDFAPTPSRYRASERFITGPAHHVYGRDEGRFACQAIGCTTGYDQEREAAYAGDRHDHRHEARGHGRHDRHGRAGVRVHRGR